jgi:hypothetical protein
MASSLHTFSGNWKLKLSRGDRISLSTFRMHFFEPNFIMKSFIPCISLVLIYQNSVMHKLQTQKYSSSLLHVSARLRYLQGVHTPNSSVYYYIFYIILCHVMSYGMIWYDMIWWYDIWYYILYYIVLYFIVLNYIALYYIILCYIILYYIILYNLNLFYIFYIDCRKQYDVHVMLS